MIKIVIKILFFKNKKRKLKRIYILKIVKNNVLLKYRNP
jgi:hypothetical protein